MAAADDAWCRETVPRVMELLSPRLPQRDACALLAVSPWCHRALVSNPRLWQVLDLREMKNAGDRLISALLLARYHHLKVLNLEFAQDIEDRHFFHLKEMCGISLESLEFLNLNACQKISDKGIEAVTSFCPNLHALSIYWIVGLTFSSIEYITKNCKKIVDLNLSGCKNISDKGIRLIADNYQGLKKLNITRCVCVTDAGVVAIAQGCQSLQLLSLFGILGVTDACLEALSKSCSQSLTTLDVNGCTGIKRRSRDDLLKLFPSLSCFKVHS